MKLLVDMNLSPEWVVRLEREGWAASHWSVPGEGDAADSRLLDWAAAPRRVLLTQDLDFPRILFTTLNLAVSVVLLRPHNELNPAEQDRVCAALRQFQAELEAGAILVIDPKRVRVRRLGA